MSIQIKATKAVLGTPKLNRVPKISSPATSIAPTQMGDHDPITGGSVSATAIDQKMVAGAGIHEIGRADQIIGGDSSDSSSVANQVGLTEPSVMKPADAGTFYGLDPETLIGGQNKGDIIMGGARGARSQEGEPKAELKPKMTKEEMKKLVDDIFKKAGADDSPLFKPTPPPSAKSDSRKNPRPDDDSQYEDAFNKRSDRGGILGKINKKFGALKDLNPSIDPNQESNYGGNGYTGPSLGAVTGSNGGTSTGSWDNPYGFGGYSGPSIDAIGFSNGGTSTGTFDPLS